MMKFNVQVALPLLLLITAASALAANSISPKDFSYRFKLTFKDGRSIYECELPAKIYEKVVSSDLADIRVFNSHDEVVPHEISSQKLRVHVTSKIPSQQLDFFPIYSTPDNHLNMRGITINKNKTGTIVTIDRPANSQKEDRELITGYLIDASNVGAKIASIEAAFDNTTKKQFLRQVIIEGSNDLESWRATNTKAVLANLTHAENKLIKNTIPLSGRSYKYYRLHWVDNNEPLYISELLATFESSSAYEETQLNWVAVSGATSKNNDSVFYYDIGAYYPVSKIQIAFSQPNSFGNITLEARNNTNQPWIHRKTLDIFSTAHNNRELNSDKISLIPRRFKFWRIKLNSQKEAFGNQVPTLKIGWAPEKLHFLARGNSPFTLAVGNARVAPIASIDLQNTAFSQSSGYAFITEQPKLGDTVKPTLLPPKEQPWKSWLLWAILIIGVCALGRMALSLVRAMDGAEKTDNK